MGYSRLRLRRGTKYEFQTVNPLLAEGEIAIEYPKAGLGNGFCRFKIGDGIRRYNDLSYAFDGASASSIIGGGADSTGSNQISLRGDDASNWILIDPILEKYEIIYDSSVNGIKVGDGIHHWSELEYIKSAGDLDDTIDGGCEDDYL